MGATLIVSLNDSGQGVGMRSDERDDIQPVIDELLELVAQLAPEARPHLALQQGVSRLVFEAYRRGLRRGRSWHTRIGRDPGARTSRHASRVGPVRRYERP